MKSLLDALAGLYDIEAPRGRGRMGLVYLARERRLDRPVASKVLDPELAADPECRQRFLSEARTIASLTHPNIVPIFTVDEIDGFCSSRWHTSPAKRCWNGSRPRERCPPMSRGG